jgi:hypothetical protein
LDSKWCSSVSDISDDPPEYCQNDKDKGKRTMRRRKSESVRVTADLYWEGAGGGGAHRRSAGVRSGGGEAAAAEGGWMDPGS